MNIMCIFDEDEQKIGICRQSFREKSFDKLSWPFNLNGALGLSKDILLIIPLSYSLCKPDSWINNRI